MKPPSTTHDDHDPLVAALRRDAARIQSAPFDPALHRMTLQLIRARTGAGTARWNWQGKPALAGMAVLAVMALCSGVWLSRPSQDSAHRMQPSPDIAAVLASSRAAVAGYSTDLSSPMPGWMSPTASLLELPRLSSVNSEHQL